MGLRLLKIDYFGLFKCYTQAVCLGRLDKFPEKVAAADQAAWSRMIQILQKETFIDFSRELPQYFHNYVTILI